MQTKRDTFRAQLEQWLSLSALPVDLERFRCHLAYAPTIEEMFALVMKAVRDAEVSQLDASTQLWAVIDRALREYDILMSRMKEQMPAKTDGIFVMDAVAPKVRDNEGNQISIDSAIESLSHSVATTIQMLARLNGWSEEGVLPERSATSKEDTYRAGTHFFLANIWSLLLSASEHLRFNEEKLSSKTQVYEDGVERTLTFFNLKLSTDILFRVARVRSHQIQLQMEADLTVRIDSSAYKNPRLSPVALPPEEYVSRQELVAVSLLDGLYHQDVMSQISLGGLTLREWVRCYATVTWFVSRSEGGLPDASLVEVSKEDLVSALMNGGVSEDHVNSFIRAATFTPDSRDLYDCPLLATATGKFYLIGFLLGAGNLLETVVSRLVTLGIHDPSKGDSFEAAVLEAVQSAGLRASGLAWQIDGEQFQCDVALLLDEHLFVIECKNDLLPPESPAQEFFFLESQFDYAAQALRISESLQAHPELLQEKFGPDASFHTATTIVLNAMPFSADGERLGVYFHDFSSLSRFLGEPNIYFTQQLMRNGQPRQIKHKIASLWDGDRPTASALLRHLEAPTGLIVEKSRWHRDKSLTGLTDEWAVVSPILKRDATSFESFLTLHGWSEDQAKDFGAFISAVADRVHGE